jgi:hypothetical protein
MKLAWRFLMLALTIVAGSLLLAACGGGGGEELSLGEYYQQFDGIEENIKTGIAALEQNETEGVIGEDVTATQNYINGYLDIVEQGVNDMKALKPPAEAKDAHNELVAALSSMLPQWKDLSEQVAGAETTSELQDLLMKSQNETAWVESSQQYADACTKLQGIADENGIDVTLDCE